MKRYRPTTPSRRNMTTVSYRAVITTNEPYKKLTHGFKRSMGRNAFGRITMNHKGGGHKRLYREIDFTMNKIGVPGVVKTVEYDPNRTGFIGLVNYKDGDKRYILLPKNVRPGQAVISAADAPITPGNRLPIKDIPLGTFVYNLELKAGAGAKIARSAGNFAQVIAKDAGFAHIKMPSTEVRKVSQLAWASIGEVSNDENRLVQLGKAGRSRWLGIRPTVRGTAMNPVDHPHGGGEGRQGRGRRRAMTRTGHRTGKGQKSRTPKKYSNVFIVSRRRVGKKGKEQ